MTGMPPKTLKLRVLPQVWNGLCLWKGQGSEGNCVGACCRYHTETEVRCGLDAVAAFPGGMSHRRVGAVLGVSDVQVVKDESRAIAKLLAMNVDWEEPSRRHDPYSGTPDNGAAEASALWSILRARSRLGSSRRSGQ